jgi:hypothetical protein
MEAIRPFPEASGVLLGGMGVNPLFEHSIPNAMMASEAGEEFWLVCIWLMMTCPIARPEYTTGPVILKRAYDLYTRSYTTDEVQNALAQMRGLLGLDSTTKSVVTLKRGHVFFPLDWNDKFHDIFRRELRDSGKLLSRDDAASLFPDSTTVTYWSHSWEPEEK